MSPPKKIVVLLLISYGLFYQATEDTIREYFKKFGDISQIKLPRDAHDNLVGLGIIQFKKKKSAASAILNCNGNSFMGKNWKFTFY
jgi:RNA recognition motif-containing protein